MTLETFSIKLRNWLAEERIEGYQVNYQNDIIRVIPDTIIPMIMIEQLSKLCKKYKLTFYITSNVEPFSAYIVIHKITI